MKKYSESQLCPFSTPLKGLPSLKQFLTFYPHSADNEHAGFVIYPPSTPPPLFSERKKWALIYAKKSSFIRGHAETLKTIGKFFDLHATLADLEETGDLEIHGVKLFNHGWQEPNDYQTLLHTAKVMVGLGFPYEGPTPIEAISNGLFFLNPKFMPTKGRRPENK